MKPYIPDDLPLTNINYRRLVKLIGRANSELARFDGLLHGIVNADLLLSPMMKEEAVQSSRIEGTQATLTDVLEQEVGMEKPEHIREDIQEILNYCDAMNYAKSYLVERPISLGFIRELHQILMQSVRGKNKSPGKFRETQNYIARGGYSIENATFIPPDPVRLMTDLEDFQRYLEADDDEILVQTAIVHAQFELLHPFLDGNGRIGRLLIPLFLHQKKTLTHPTFYISGYLEKNREMYYQCLRNISEKKDWDGWVEFFLTAIISQAKTNSEMVKSMIGLYERMKITISEVTRSRFSVSIQDALFKKPVFRASDLSEISGVNIVTVNYLLRELKKHGIVQKMATGGGNRASHLVFPELLSMIDYPDFVE